jgi:hypothetical protein
MPELPTDTVLDGPDRNLRLDNEAAKLLKSILLLQPQVPEMRAHGLSDTEIINTMVELLDAGLFELIQHGDQIGFIPTDKAWTTAGIEPPASGWEPRAKRRPRRRLSRP